MQFAILIHHLGVLSHQVKRYIVDGNRVIINKETQENKVDEFEFEENEVYCIDLLFSTGEGKAREAEAKTTVYKRAVDVEYNLKLKASREAMHEINKKFPTFPFTLRYLFIYFWRENDDNFLYA